MYVYMIYKHISYYMFIRYSLLSRRGRPRRRASRPPSSSRPEAVRSGSRAGREELLRGFLQFYMI